MPDKSARRQSLSGWGNYPRHDCFVHEVASQAQQRSLITSTDSQTLIARGLGRSYGDSAVNALNDVLLQTSRNRFLSLSETGLLRCEAGLSFAEIIKYLIPRGWALPTTPGTKFVTVGGAIASDVHGKNHHQCGSLGNFVQAFRLLTASGDVLDCSRESHPDLFWATIGGMGLTGIILTAQIQLNRVETAWVKQETRRTRNLTDTLDLFVKTDQDYQYSVAWIDCLKRGSSMGRSVVMLANDASVSDLPDRRQQKPLQMKKRRRKKVPFNLPSITLNRLTVSAFNGVYFRAHRDKESVVSYDEFFYPLDSIQSWNRIYGKRGFIQYQALIPKQNSFDGMHELLELISKSRQASFLAVLKSCGPADDGILSYLFPGHTLALDFPFKGPRTIELCKQLDEVLLKLGGRIYAAKDAVTNASTFHVMYPRLEEFLKVKRQIDPENVFSSSQGRRLGLIPT